MAISGRLAAILAADVVGYSRLMGADEEGTLERLKALRRELIDPKIAEHHGRIVKTTGDGMLVEFPSVVDAVRVAADSRIELRIGINLGDVIVEGDDLYGDGVNIAARIEALADAGGVFVSNTVYDHVRDRLPFVFEDLGEQRVKNIARPVRVYRVMPNSGVSSLELLNEPPALPNKPSVAVLPFTNMSNDPEQEFFADGIAEDIITAMSRYPSLFVIARNSSFTYKGRAVDVKQIGRELGVRYVLEGSLRKSGNRIRVTGQLIEAESSNHVWTERYDRDLVDIFAVQDEITEAVTTAIAPAIADAERQRAVRRPPSSLDAWGAYQSGLWHLSRFTAADTELAQTFFQRAIALDRGFAGGYSGLAAAQLQAANTFMSRDLAEVIKPAEGYARQAVALDAADAEAHTCLGRVLLHQGNYEGARVEVERALAISPNLASAHGMLGSTLIFSGHPKEGLVALERGIRLDPRDPRSGVSINQVVLSLYFAREYEAAIEAAKRVIHSYPDHPLVYRWLAAALGQAGRIDEAKEALAKAVAIAPASFDLCIRRRAPWHHPEDHAHTLEGLRKAGWEG
jgi:adenylate cyclase